MTLDENTEKLRDEVYAVIERKEQEAYMKGYTAGVESMFDRAKNWRDSMVRLKGAPSAMDGMTVAPVPCVEGWECASLKVFFQKLNEEVDELKAAILDQCDFDDNVNEIKEILNYYEDSDVPPQASGGKMRIAEEAADVCTVVTSLCEAIGIGFEMRNDAQKRVNDRNHERRRN